MDPRLVCEIFVQDKDGKTMSRGSGYPITRNRVLTAHHVLTPKSGDADSIQVCFEYKEFDEKGEPKTHRADLKATQVSCGTTAQQFDAAILAVELPDNLQPGHLLLHDPPLVNVEVRGQGFPNLTKDQARRRKDAFDGTLRTFTKAETFVQFDVENSPEDKSRWAGASGSGVFDNCEPSHMFGVLTTHAGGKERSQLFIVPLPALLQLDKFREAIQYAETYEPRAKHRDIVVQKVTECLSQWRKADTTSFVAFEDVL